MTRSNSPRLSDRVPMKDGGASRVTAHSVFTHLSRDQSAYYLSEVRRVLADDGVEAEVWRKRAVGWRAAGKVAGWLGLRRRA
jgi:hypothetical protein